MSATRNRRSSICRRPERWRLTARPDGRAQGQGDPKWGDGDDGSHLDVSSARRSKWATHALLAERRRYRSRTARLRAGDPKTTRASGAKHVQTNLAPFQTEKEGGGMASATPRRARAPGRHARRDVAHPRGDARGGAPDRARRLAAFAGRRRADERRVASARPRLRGVGV